MAKSKLNSIEPLVSQALVAMEISHEEFITILKEKDKYEKMKENLRNLSEKLEEKQKNMRLSNESSGNDNHFVTHKWVAYKMSSEAKRLTKERKITAETNLKSKLI